MKYPILIFLLFLALNLNHLSHLLTDSGHSGMCKYLVFPHI